MFFKIFFLNKSFTLTVVGVSSFYFGMWWNKFNTSSNPYISSFKIFDAVNADNVVSMDSQITSLKEQRISQIMRYGFPGMDNIRSYSNFVLSYDQRNRIPHWVLEHLTPESVKYNSNVDRSLCEFFEDTSFHPFFRATNKDYKNSGFDRGHLAAAGNHKSNQELVNQTFVLSNIAPQVGNGFNRDAWNQLEKYVRKKARYNKNVYVCSGPMFLPKKGDDGKLWVKYQVIGDNHVAVPTHFYKIIVIEGNDSKFYLESYIMPNQVIPKNIPLKDFQMPLELIERASGLQFFKQLTLDKFAKINN
ncbi:endonuclease G, mitochondrial-like [Daktulosphaira vitifoliae]|uniref:endonuclease G, mitochondrial-like n=1 Tax=Daktulosphaira vitifoliae TaxID=58002 RepID=UPI0021AA9D67|nr:endonuclease G, mitochondrial-like [Daktulosphaira vitifoliae]